MIIYINTQKFYFKHRNTEHIESKQKINEHMEDKLDIWAISGICLVKKV